MCDFYRCNVHLDVIKDFFFYQQMHLNQSYKTLKLIYIKTAATCFGL